MEVAAASKLEQRRRALQQLMCVDAARRLRPRDQLAYLMVAQLAIDQGGDSRITAIAFEIGKDLPDPLQVRMTRLHGRPLRNEIHHATTRACEHTGSQRGAHPSDRNQVKKRFDGSGVTLTDFASRPVALVPVRCCRIRAAVSSLEHFGHRFSARKCDKAKMLHQRKPPPSSSGADDPFGSDQVPGADPAPGPKSRLYWRTSTKPTRPGVLPLKKMRFELVGSISSRRGSLSASGSGNSIHSCVLGSKRAILST
jgi:hypothetical protein